ncbi:unnamed protein product [Didymodactylos carnosus]|uniref:Beta-lactamase-related domain-containing protein n=1 Tax=Didymodactylos carnosus TaxID=1234261 RepID=A0A814NG45_9BILA|nr:unnamed protein product [Didymodactylos carnosus]CAF3857842.1 unnamed protein product [Didymodactylos carnosus]
MTRYYYYYSIIVVVIVFFVKLECKDALNISGTVDDKWKLMRNLFEQNFIQQLDIGASVAIYHQGKLVVDLSGGWFDEQQTKVYTNDTLQLVFSVSKGIVAIAVALCVQNGLIDYDEKVIKYWPEYEQMEKGNTTVADIMSHRAGLPDVNATVKEWVNWKTMIQLLEKEKPTWPPGTAHGYHTLTYGWLAGELVRRVDPKNRTLGQFIREEIATRTSTEFYFGLDNELEYRVSPLVDPTNNAFNEFNDLVVHQAEIPAANGITNARSLARIYASIIGDLPDGQKRLLNEATLARAIKSNTPVNEPDMTLFNSTTVFSMGFMLFGQQDSCLLDAFCGAFGHNGESNNIEKKTVSSL